MATTTLLVTRNLARSGDPSSRHRDKASKESPAVRGGQGELPRSAKRSTRRVATFRPPACLFEATLRPIDSRTVPAKLDDGSVLKRITRDAAGVWFAL